MRKFVLMLFLLMSILIFSEEKVNPFEDLYNWTFKQNIGITILSKNKLFTSDWDIGAKWNLLTSKHDWLYAGLVATQEPTLGIAFGFNLGKLIEKIKGKPLVYLKHFELGVYKSWGLDRDINNRKGFYINVLKFEF